MVSLLCEIYKSHFEDGDAAVQGIKNFAQEIHIVLSRAEWIELKLSNGVLEPMIFNHCTILPLEATESKNSLLLYAPSISLSPKIPYSKDYIEMVEVKCKSNPSTFSVMITHPEANMYSVVDVFQSFSCNLMDSHIVFFTSWLAF